MPTTALRALGMLSSILLLALALLPVGVTRAGDPFNDARYAIETRDSPSAVRLFDGGQLDINMPNGEGNTLLHFAAGAGNLEMVEELLMRGANPNAANASGLTPLDRAVGTTVRARIRAAVGPTGTGSNAAGPAPATPAPATPAPATPVTDTGAGKPVIPSPAAQSPHAKMCASRHYSSSALCSDSTCKMREYRKWQTCLKTGSYY